MPGFVGIIKSIFGICETSSLSPDFWSIEGNKVRVKVSQMPEPLHEGGAVYLQGQGLKNPVLLLIGQSRYDRDIHLLPKRILFS